MKLSNKIIVISAVGCAFCLGLAAAVFICFPRQDNSNRGYNKDKYEYSVQTENNLSESVKEKSAYETYIIKLEGSKITAYVKLPDGNLTLWNSIPVPPTLSKKDEVMLKNGIYTKSFEELCLYFESYSS